MNEIAIYPSLKNKVVLITGGAQGIGESIVEQFIKQKSKVAFLDIDEKAAENLVNKISLEYKQTPLFIKCDLKDIDELKSSISLVRERLGGISVLVNNAGTNIRKRPEEYELQEWKSIIDTNLISMFTCSKACFKHFKAVDSGKIINIGSMHSLFGAPLGSAYSASKGGVVQLTKSLANAWAKDNIQVNAVLPGYIDTTLTRQARIDIPELQARVEERTPVGRWGEPDDLGGIAVFLSSDGSNYVSGTAIPVDGGYSING